MIQLNRTTIWKDFSQYVFKYMALKVCSLKYFEQCISPATGMPICHTSMHLSSVGSSVVRKKQRLRIMVRIIYMLAERVQTVVLARHYDPNFS